MNEENIKSILKNRLLEKRYMHSLEVMKMAIRLAKINNENEDDARFAGLLHDCAKNYSNEELVNYCDQNNIEIDDIKRSCPGMLHADVGAHIARYEFGANEKIVEAIKYHTLGHPNMSKLDKIIYVADLIEESRELEGVDEIRKIALNNLDEGYLVSLKFCIDNVKERGKDVHPQSIEAFKEAVSMQNN